MARSMVSRGTELSRALANMVRSVGLASGSPPPSRAATSTWRISLAKSLPRALSAAPFLCLIVAHLLCPDIPNPPPRLLRRSPHPPHSELIPEKADAVAGHPTTPDGTRLPAPARGGTPPGG